MHIFLKPTDMPGGLAVAGLGHLGHGEQQSVLSLAYVTGSGDQAVFQLIVAGAKIAMELVILIEGIFLLKGMLDLGQQLAWMKRLGQIVIGAAHQRFR